MLPRANLATAVEAAERIRAGIASAPCYTERDNVHPTVSVGVAQADRSEDAAGLIGRADEALYASKDNGRNCGHFHDGRSCRRIGTDELATNLPTETVTSSSSAVPEALLDALDQLGAAAEPANPSCEPADPQLKNIYDSLRDRLASILAPGGPARP